MGFQTWDATKPLNTHSFGMPVYVSPEMINRQVHHLAMELKREFSEGMPLFVPILKGGVHFYNDLSLALQFEEKPIPHDVAYVLAKRYGSLTVGRENVDMNWWDIDRTDLRGKTALLIDDILDEGITASAASSGLRERGASRVLTAFACRKTPAKTKFTPDYVMFDVPADIWCAGYGMDWNFSMRNMRQIVAVRRTQFA